MPVSATHWYIMGVNGWYIMGVNAWYIMGVNPWYIIACKLTWLALLQVLPIGLWILFHGSGISDGSPPSAFVAHWGYALPHLALFLLSGACCANACRRAGFPSP